MDLPDVNILVYAFRADLEHHAACRAWLEHQLVGDAPFGLSPLALSAVVRITTNRRTFREPSSHAEAFDFCEDLLDHPNCRRIEPGAGHWRLFRRLCEDTGTVGRAVTDVWYAALAI